MKPMFPSGEKIVTVNIAMTLLVLLVIFSSSAQITQPRRYEKLYKGSDDVYQIISLKDSGLALFRDLNKYRNTNKLWQLTLLDTALQVTKELELEVKDRNKFIGYEVTKDHLFFLFRTGETTKNDFELIDVDLKGSEAGRYPFKPDLDFKLTHFTRAGSNFIFGGYVNNEPASSFVRAS